MCTSHTNKTNRQPSQKFHPVLYRHLSLAECNLPSYKQSLTFGHKALCQGPDVFIGLFYTQGVHDDNLSQNI